MKILFVSSGNSHYGITPFIKSQGESLKEQGVDLEYYTIKGKGIKGYLKNILPLRKYIKEKNFDLVHAHYGLTALTCLLTFVNVPIVISVMGSDAYGDFDNKGRRIKSSYIEMVLTQIALFFSKRIIVKSKNLYNYIPYKKKTVIIPNGVNINTFKPNNNTFVKNKILWLANPKDPRKNFNLILKAFELLKGNDVTNDVTLVNPYPIKHSDFPKYLNNCSVFVLTSYNEGSPNVIKEAMSCNVPIVSTDVGDVREVTGNTEGCFITSFDPEDVADKIKKALEFGKRTNGRQRIIELGLDSKTVAKKIIKVYEEVLKN